MEVYVNALFQILQIIDSPSWQGRISPESQSVSIFKDPSLQVLILVLQLFTYNTDFTSS
jgi:hypothetical protein